MQSTYETNHRSADNIIRMMIIGSSMLLLQWSSAGCTSNDDGSSKGSLIRTLPPGSFISSDTVNSDAGAATTEAENESQVDDDNHIGSDLPYDARPQVGETYQLVNSFLEKGPAPAAIISVEPADVWRHAELAGNTAFVITQADCDHQGNRDVSRDRIIVTWQNADGSQESDHLDMRYCD